MAAECLDQFESAAINRRKGAIRSFPSNAEDDPMRLVGVVPALVLFLEDDHRSVRLTTGEVLVDVAKVNQPPSATTDGVASYLADEVAFYFEVDGQGTIQGVELIMSIHYGPSDLTAGIPTESSLYTDCSVFRRNRSGCIRGNSVHNTGC